MTAVDRWISTLRPADLFSVPVVLGVAVEFALIQFASPYNTVPNVLLTAVMQVLAVAVAFAVLGALFLGLRSRVRTEVLRVVLLVGIPFAALAGGFVLVWARRAVGLDQAPLWFVRSASTVMHVTALSVLLWLAVSNIRLHYLRLDALGKERDRLEALDLEVERSLAILDVPAVEAVRTRILHGLGAPGSVDPRALFMALTDTLEETVRPLSRQLESQVEDWMPPDPAPRAPQRIDWRAAAVDGMAPDLLSPVGLIVILNLIGAPMNIARSGWPFELAFVLVSAVIVWPLFVLIRRGAIRLAGTARGRRRTVAFLIMCLACGLALGLAMLPLTLGAPQPYRFLYLGPIFALIIPFIWGLAVAAQRQARATGAELEATTRALRWHIARSRELHRQRRRALAHALHGRVQAALAAGILELDRAMRDGTASPELVQGVRGRIIDSVRDLDLRTLTPSTLMVIVNKVRATWGDALTLTVEVDPGLDQALDSDPQCLMTLNDLIPELVFNSVKHGGASNATVKLDVVSERVIRIDVDDDGIALAHGKEPGLGTKLLDTCAIEWSRDRQGSITTTSVILPFANPREASNGGDGTRMAVAGHAANSL